MKGFSICALLVCLAAAQAAAAPDPATTFARKCSSCHTYGGGVLVGPDLKGVTNRHPRPWLMSWIASSETVIRSGDAAANALFTKFKAQRMPDQALGPADLAALIDYLAAGGPEADAARRNRRADSATAGEIAAGRRLFVGEQPLANGGAPCLSCHTLGTALGAGGTLGPDLHAAYARYQDRGLAALLARGCFPRSAPRLTPVTLTDPEAFALKAFLRREGQVAR
jgi:cytochrome c2